MKRFDLERGQYTDWMTPWEFLPEHIKITYQSQRQYERMNTQKGQFDTQSRHGNDRRKSGKA